MGYLYLFIVAFIFSFGGLCSKSIAPFFGADFISMFRFTVGVFFLLLLKLIKRHKFRADFKDMFRACAVWIFIGALAKWGAYLTENYALARGPSYGNIITQPAQAVFITLCSIFLFREKMTWAKLGCIFMCLCGVLCISWNGRPLNEFFESSIFLTFLFVLSGFGSGAHILAQKIIADRMDIIDSNLTIFSIGALFSFIPVVPEVANGALVGVHPNLACIAGILMFGFTTGIGFYMNAKAIPLVPLYMVPVIQSTMVIFSILWGVLFFHEKITAYIICGAAVFVVGLITLNILNKKQETEKA